MTTKRIRSDLANLEAYAAWLRAGQRGTTRDRMIEDGGRFYTHLVADVQRIRDTHTGADWWEAEPPVQTILNRAGVAWRSIQEQAGQLSLFA